MTTKLTENAKELARSVISAGGGRCGDKSLAIAYVPVSSKLYARASCALNAGKSDGKTVLGVVAVETRAPHPDSLSVTGIWVSPTDALAPKLQSVFVVAGADGTPDIDHLFRDGGKLSRILNGVQ